MKFRVAFLFAFCLLTGPAAFSETANAPIISSDQLSSVFAACRTDWTQYTRRLNDVYKTIFNALKTMEERDYNNAALAHDPALLLAQVTWPALLEKDPYASFYQQCADFHQELRQAFNLGGARAMKDSYGKFRDCIRVNYRQDLQSEPFKSMLACYKQRAGL